MEKSTEYFLALGDEASWTAEEIVSFAACFHQEAWDRGIDDPKHSRYRGG